MAMVFLRGQVETFTGETTMKTRDMEMAKCYGPIKVCTKENGTEEYNTESGE